MLAIGLQLLLAEGPSWGVYVVSYPYVLPLLLMPMQLTEARQLVAAVALGFFIDLLYDTIGIHIAATVLLTYGRRLTIEAFTPTSLQESQIYPRPLYMGWSWYIIYISILLFLHQLCIFSLEAGTLPHTLYTISALFRSFFATWLFFCLVELLRLLFPKQK